MRQKKHVFSLYGLRAHFIAAFFLYGFLSIFVFFFLSSVSDYFLNSYFMNSDVETVQLSKQVRSLQKYIDKKDITEENIDLLGKWEKKQPLMLLELYKGDDCIYTSQMIDDMSLIINHEADQMDEHTFGIDLDGKTVTALIYSDFSYSYYTMMLLISFIISVSLFFLLYLRTITKLIQYIRKLDYDIQILEGGNLDYPVTVQRNDELTHLAQSMNRMRESFADQLKTEQLLYQSHRRLITEMSHDLKTPLTGMMLYLEILRSGHYKTNEELQSYLEKIDAKAHQMKQISEHLMEYTLEGNTPKLPELLTMENIFSKRFAFFKEELLSQGFEVEDTVFWESCFLSIKPDYIERILENILSNLTRYASKDFPVFIETFYDEQSANLIFTNTVSPTADHQASIGLGLKSIETMMQQMNGTCFAEQTESTFEISLQFYKV